MRGEKCLSFYRKKLLGRVLRLIGAAFITQSSLISGGRLGGKKKKVNEAAAAAAPYPSYPGCWDQPPLPQGPGSLEEDWLLGELR